MSSLRVFLSQKLVMQCLPYCILFSQHHTEAIKHEKTRIKNPMSKAQVILYLVSFSCLLFYFLYHLLCWWIPNALLVSYHPSKSSDILPHLNTPPPPHDVVLCDKELLWAMQIACLGMNHITLGCSLGKRDVG